MKNYSVHIEHDNLGFWKNPHNLTYKIFYEYDFDAHKYKEGQYRLMEFDEWDEFHQVDILRNATLEQIFMMVDIIGGELENREDWEYSLKCY